ncbi:MAG TPA: membrane protein insertase YidC [Xanthomonadaceae bacterium]|nr:membrane protein insertase YidC [Xanthomonadaceae bacterium]
MNQTRTFLILAWLMVATFLWMAWTREHAAPAPAATASSQPAATAAVADDAGVPAVPQAPAAAATPAAPAMSAAAPAASVPVVSVTTDVLQVRLDGGSVRSARLTGFPQTTEPGSPPVQLFADDPARLFEAQSGWVSGSGAAPSHEAFVPVEAARSYALAPGANTLDVPFVWHGPNGVTVRRVYTFTRGDYAIGVRDTVVNQGGAPWQGHVYRQLLRVPPQVKSGFTHPESYSFHGAAWYSAQDKFEKRKFDKYGDEAPLQKEVKGGWIAMLQHHFFAAWIPAADDTTTFSTDVLPGGAAQRMLIREVGPGVNVAPGQQAQTSARLWVGPKLVAKIDAQRVPGLERAVDFSSYGWLAWIAGLLFSVLAFLHGLFGNWGWAIIGLVVIVKALMFPLSAAQYKSAAKMRRFQPRIEQLKERYGDDKQKFQLALMELYKKEKINPVGGCLPVLVQMPVFLALYWVLLESVELRQAPWIGWIQNLTAPDPFFILPALNVAVTWATQKLTPMPGMDPTQKKLMQFMPIAMGVMFAFFPAGLVLYWVTNGSLGLLQQWWMTRKYGGAAQPAKA